MGNKEDAKLWIKNYELKKDIFRVKYLDPFLKRVINKKTSKATVLDIGCGWGTTIKFLKPDQKYIGIDINKIFLEYIKKTYNHKYIKPKKGKLPTKIPVKDDLANLTICSMVLLELRNIKSSIETLFKKTKKGGEVCIINLSKRGTKYAIQSFKRVDKKGKNYMKGLFKLPSGIKIKTKIYLHKEEEIES